MTETVSSDIAPPAPADDRHHPSGSPTTAPRRVRRAAGAGAAVAMLAFAWMVTAGSFDLFERQQSAADFYDAQARSWLEGRWAIEPGILGIEAFEIGDEEHTYFGVVPVVLRLPVALVTAEMDGRLTQTSMLLALGVALAATSSLSWTTRVAVRGTVPVERRDVVVAGVVPLVAGAGTVVMFLASRPWVYHEAILWGAAMALTSFAGLARHLLTGRPGPLALAAVAAVGALHSRASVGAGPLAALCCTGVLAAAVVLDDRWPRSAGGSRVRSVRRAIRAQVVRLAPGAPAPWTVVATVGLTLAVAVGSYVGVNVARFGEPLRLPIERQTYALISEERQAVLAANDGSFFGAQFVPTTLWHYTRPDALHLGRVAPFIGFAPDVDVLGDVRFDTLDPTASVPATMPALAVAGAAGIWVVGSGVRRGRASGALAVPLLGAAVGAVTALAFGYVAERYKGDALPLLVLAALPAIHRLGDRGARPRRAGVVVLVVLAGWGVVANTSLAVLYQRQVAPSVSPELRAGLVGAQVTASERVPGARLPPVEQGGSLPAVDPGGRLFVLGDCEALYWSDGQRWNGVERAARAGRWTLDLDWPDTDPGAVRPLLSVGDADTANVLVAVDQPDGSVRIGYLWDGAEGERESLLGRPIEVDRGDGDRLQVIFDPHNVEIHVEIDGRLAYQGYRFAPRPGAEVGHSDAGGEVVSRFGGSVRDVTSGGAGVCERLVDAVDDLEVGAAPRLHGG